VESVPVVESAVVPAQDDESKTRTQGELRVYTREKEPVESLVPHPLSIPASTPETPSSTMDSDYPGDMIPLSTPPTPLSVMRESHLIDMGSTLIMILLIMSLTLTYHLVMEHSLYLWILFFFLSVGRMLRKILSGKRPC
jgi:hypothetical protein